MFPEYGPALIGAAWWIGHMVWLRQSTGPTLVKVTGTRHGLVEITPNHADGMPMMVPAERLADSYREAVA